jgi:hypothetical protein
MPSFRRSRVPVLRSSAVVIIAALACSTSPDSSHVGLYHLETISGQPLPQEVGAYTVDGGTLHLREDGTWFDSTAIRNAGSPDGTYRLGLGVYERNANLIELIPAVGDQASIMTYSARNRTLTAQKGTGDVWVYQK